MSRRPKPLSILSGVFFFGIGAFVFVAEAAGKTVDDKAILIVGLVAIGAALLALARRRANAR